MESLVPTLCQFCLMYFFIYLFGYYVLFRNWSPKHRPEASSCFISLAHGTPVVALASYAILYHTKTPYSLNHENTIFQNTVLEYSISYFLVDLSHFLVFYPNDLVFIGHHLATLFVFMTCRYLVCHGALAILVLLVLAEMTSFCQNIWTLANARKDDIPMAAKIYEFLSPVFYSFYSVARGVLGSLFIYKMGVYYWSGAADDVIPRWVWIPWMLVIVAANSVSILWVCNLWICLIRERNNKACQKLK